MTENTFAPGDVVRLKSGSMRLTVHRVHPEDRIEVVWMTYETKLMQYAEVHANALVRDVKRGSP